MNSRIFLCLAISEFAFLATSVHGADWPQFRGPSGQGVSDVKSLPTQWSQTENVPWKQEIPGAGWSSPILHQNRIYLTTALSGAAGGNLSLRVLCLEAQTGRLLWNTEVITATPVRAHQKNSHASPTPVTDGQRLYVHFGQYGTAALDLAGRVLWRNTNLKYKPVHGNGGSPIIVGDALVYSADAEDAPFVIALNKATGFTLWRVPRNTSAQRKFSFSTPLAINAAGRTQVISPGSGAAISYDAGNGREIWRVRYGEGYSVIPRPVYGHGLIYFSSGFDRATLYAVHPNGAGDVTDSHVAWSTSRGAPKTPSPVLAGDEIYFVSDDGLLSCADAKKGTLHWQERVGGNYSASPIYGAGHIYVQSEEGVATVVKAAKTFQPVGKNDLKERTLASWAVDDGIIFIRTEKHLYRIQEPVEKAGAIRNQ